MEEFLFGKILDFNRTNHCQLYWEIQWKWSRNTLSENEMNLSSETSIFKASEAK